MPHGQSLLQPVGESGEDQFHPDWYIEEMRVDRDHVPVPMIILPQYAVSEGVAIWKGLTSRKRKEKFPHVLKKTSCENGSSGY